jgi:hypothetical protein
MSSIISSFAEVGLVLFAAYAPVSLAKTNINKAKKNFFIFFTPFYLNFPKRSE